MLIVIIENFFDNNEFTQNSHFIVNKNQRLKDKRKLLEKKSKLINYILYTNLISF